MGVVGLEPTTPSLSRWFRALWCCRRKYRNAACRQGIRGYPEAGPYPPVPCSFGGHVRNLFVLCPCRLGVCFWSVRGDTGGFACSTSCTCASARNGLAEARDEGLDHPQDRSGAVEQGRAGRLLRDRQDGQMAPHWHLSRIARDVRPGVPARSEGHRLCRDHVPRAGGHSDCRPRLDTGLVRMGMRWRMIMAADAPCPPAPPALVAVFNRAAQFVSSRIGPLVRHD